MDFVRVGKTTQELLPDGRHSTHAVFTVGGDNKYAYFNTSPDIPFVTRAKGDIWLPTALLIAMTRGEDLVIVDPISEGRLKDIEKVQDILTVWYPNDLHRVTIKAPLEDPLTPLKVEPEPAGLLSRLRRRETPDTEPEPAKVVATCFTGGVDSFHTLITRREQIGALIYGFGIDVPLTEVEATERVQALLDRVSAETGLPVLTAETNVRRVMGGKVSWGFYGHGAGIASLATIFSEITDHVMIPATHSYAAWLPWGSHPLLDHLWSTERLEIEHTGAESGRADKVRLIADEKVVQENLRVCYAEFDDLNCGRCMKCMRTMAALAVADRLDRFTTFGIPLDIDRFASMPLKTENDRNQIENLVQVIEKVGGHEDIAAAAKSLLDGYDARMAAGEKPWRPGDPVSQASS